MLQLRAGHRVRFRIPHGFSQSAVEAPPFDLFKSSVDTCVVDWNVLNVEISTAESCRIHLPPSAILLDFFCNFCFKKITDVWDVIVLRCERTRGVNLRSDADPLASGVWVNCVACSHFRMAPTGERKGM